MDPTNNTRPIKKPMLFKRMISNKGKPCTCPYNKDNEVNARIVPHFHCQLCDFISTYWNCVLRHEARSHEFTRPGLNRFKCVSCSRIFVYVYDYVQHLRKHVDEEPGNEQIDAEIARYDHFVGVVSKQSHVQAKTAKFSQAIKRLPSKQQFKRQVVAQSRIRDDARSVGNVFHCKKCGFRTRYKHSFFRHETLVHGLETAADSNSLMYECVPCNIKTRNRWDYQKHLETKRHKAVMSSIEETELPATTTLPATDGGVSQRLQTESLPPSSADNLLQPLPMCKLKVRRTNNEWKCDTVEVSKSPSTSLVYDKIKSTEPASNLYKHDYRNRQPLKIRMPNVLKFGIVSKHTGDSFTQQIDVSADKNPFVSLQRLTFQGNRVFVCCGSQPKVSVRRDENKAHGAACRSSIRCQQTSQAARRRVLPKVTAKKLKSAMMYHHMVRNQVDRSAVTNKATVQDQEPRLPTDTDSLSSSLQVNDKKSSTSLPFEPVILAAYSVDPGLWSTSEVQTSAVDCAESNPLAEQPDNLLSDCIGAGSHHGAADMCTSASVKLAVHISSIPFDAEPTVFTIASPVIAYKSPMCAESGHGSRAVFKNTSNHLSGGKLADHTATNHMDTLKRNDLVSNGSKPRLLQVSISSVPFSQHEYEFVIPPTASSFHTEFSVLNGLSKDNFVTNCKLSNNVNLFSESELDDPIVGKDVFADHSDHLNTTEESRRKDNGASVSFKQPHRLCRKQERPQRSHCFPVIASIIGDEDNGADRSTPSSNATDVVDYVGVAVDLQDANVDTDSDVHTSDALLQTMITY